MRTLIECRDAIDSIDTEIIKLLEKRQEVAEDIANIKLAQNKPIVDREREAQKLVNLSNKAREHKVSSLLIKDLYERIMQHTVGYEKTFIIEKAKNKDLNYDTSISYLGTIGTYSHLAAMKFLEHFSGKIRQKSCQTFDDIIKAVENDETDFGILPIENSSSGSINEVLDLIKNTKCSIVGEIYYAIDHSILVSGETKLSNIKRIYAHPQPIAQCSHWLKQNFKDVELIPVNSSSHAINKLTEDSKEAAAIASFHAAAYYNLNAIATDIANNKKNYTRFVVISKEAFSVPSNIKAKTSIIFSTSKYTPGSLVKVLNEFSNASFNVTKLISRPKEEDNKETWEEIFFADIDANVNDAKMIDILDKLKSITSECKVLGCYAADN